MEHLKDTEKFIVYKKKLDALGGTKKINARDVEENLSIYISKLVSWVERFVFNKISKRVNWILDRQKDDTLEITKSDNAIEAAGNWRFKINGDDLEVERYNGTSWDTVWRYKGS